MVNIHETAIDFIRRFTGEDLSNRGVIEEFSDQSILDTWIGKQYPEVSQEVRNAMSLVAQPYFEQEDTPVYIVPWVDTLFIK